MLFFFFGGMWKFILIISSVNAFNKLFFFSFGWINFYSSFCVTSFSLVKGKMWIFMEISHKHFAFFHSLNFLPTCEIIVKINGSLIEIEIASRRDFEIFIKIKVSIFRMKSKFTVKSFQINSEDFCVMDITLIHQLEFLIPSYLSFIGFTFWSSVCLSFLCECHIKWVRSKKEREKKGSWEGRRDLQAWCCAERKIANLSKGKNEGRVHARDTIFTFLDSSQIWKNKKFSRINIQLNFSYNIPNCFP